MTWDTDQFSTSEWVKFASSKSSQDTRSQVTSQWARANGYASPDKLIQDIKAGLVNLYTAANTFVTWLLGNKRAPTTVSEYDFLKT